MQSKLFMNEMICKKHLKCTQIQFQHVTDTAEVMHKGSLNYEYRCFPSANRTSVTSYTRLSNVGNLEPDVDIYKTI